MEDRLGGFYTTVTLLLWLFFSTKENKTITNIGTFIIAINNIQ